MSKSRTKEKSDVMRKLDMHNYRSRVGHHKRQAGYITEENDSDLPVFKYSKLKTNRIHM
jgi:hypothetical protein